MAKAPEEIAELKRQWRLDGCWDIEDTDGFEEHRDELLAFRLQLEAERDAAIAAEEKRKAERFRGLWTREPDEIDGWMNEQVQEGYGFCSIIPCVGATEEGGEWQGVYVLMELRRAHR